MFAYMTQPVVQLVVQKPVEQPAVSYIQTFNRLSQASFNRLCGLTTMVEQPATNIQPVVEQPV